MRTHEVLDILEVSKLILNACLLRKSSSKPLCFQRSDFPETDPERDKHFITIRKEGGEIIRGDVPHDFYGDIEEGYLEHNQDYVEQMKRG